MMCSLVSSSNVGGRRISTLTMFIEQMQDFNLSSQYTLHIYSYDKLYGIILSCIFKPFINKSYTGVILPLLKQTFRYLNVLYIISHQSFYPYTTHLVHISNVLVFVDLNIIFTLPPPCPPIYIIKYLKSLLKCI